MSESMAHETVEASSPEEAYLDRVRCTFDPALRDLASPEIREVLGSYFELQDRWRYSALRAAEAETSFVRLTGKPSHELVPDKSRHDSKIWETDPPENSPTVRRQAYQGFGHTLAAQQAEEDQVYLHDFADAHTQYDVAEADGLSELDRTVLRPLLAKTYPTNPATSDVLGYGVEVHSLLQEVAQEKEGKPVVMIRRRVRNKTSDIIVADDFTIEPTDEGLQLVLHNAERCAFERFGMTSYGGRREVTGSFNMENVWQPIPDPEVEHFDRLEVMDLLSRDQLTRTPEGSFPVLRALAVATPDTFWQTFDRLYARSGMSGRGELRSDSDGTIAVLAHDQAYDTLFAGQSEKSGLLEYNWRRAVDEALRAIGEYDRSRETAKLLGKVAEIAESPEAFYGVSPVDVKQE